LPNEAEVRRTEVCDRALQYDSCSTELGGTHHDLRDLLHQGIFQEIDEGSEDFGRDQRKESIHGVIATQQTISERTRNAELYSHPVDRRVPLSRITVPPVELARPSTSRGVESI
jgi:hypothetical protein